MGSTHDGDRRTTSMLRAEPPSSTAKRPVPKKACMVCTKPMTNS